MEDILVWNQEVCDLFKYADLIGKPFELNARGSEKYDCWGICIELGKRAGLALPKHLTPNTNKHQEAAIETVKSRFVRLDKPKPFCIAKYRMHG